MHSLPKDRRLHGRDCLGALFREGSRASCGTVAVRALPNGTGQTRIAAAAGKSLARSAVKRSRMRRLLRAAYRTQQAALPAGWDMVLIARAGLLEAEWADITRDLAKAVRRAAAGSASPRPGPGA